MRRRRSYGLIYRVSMLTVLVCCQASADYCPTPGTWFDHKLNGVVSYDWQFGFYRYYYSVSSDPKSVAPIDTVYIPVSEEPFSHTTMFREWSSEYHTKTFGLKAYLEWSTYISTVPEKSNRPGGLGEPDFAIRPGQSMEGFTIQSVKPPGIVQYYIEGFQDLASVTGYGAPKCPEIDFDNPKLRSISTGITVGPEDPDVTSIRLRLRKNGAHERFGDFDSKNMSGRLYVLILSTKSFDTKSIDVSTLEFGPEGIKPLSSEVVASKMGEPFIDEREAWERFSDIFVGNQIGGSKSNLLLTFDLASIGIKCGLDKALFLKGKTVDGKSLLGGASIKLLGCDIRKPGIRPFYGEPDPGC